MSSSLQVAIPQTPLDDKEESPQLFGGDAPGNFEDVSWAGNLSQGSFPLQIRRPQLSQSGVAEIPTLRVVAQSSQTTANRAIYEHLCITINKAPGVAEATDERAKLEEDFERLVEKWKKETGGCSITIRRYAHPAYQSILTLGERVIPLILRETARTPRLVV